MNCYYILQGLALFSANVLIYLVFNALQYLKSSSVWKNSVEFEVHIAKKSSCAAIRHPLFRAFVEY